MWAQRIRASGAIEPAVANDAVATGLVDERSGAELDPAMARQNPRITRHADE